MGAIDAVKHARASVQPDGRVAPAVPSPFTARTVVAVLASSATYYFATQVAWLLCFPDSKVSLFFPPHAVLVCILLQVPTRHWWAFTLGAAAAHFLATQQAGWPPLYALHCEAFDATQNLLTAAGIRFLIKSPFDRLTLREAVIFVLVAIVALPFGTALWGAAFTISNGFGVDYWVEWRNLGVSNGVTMIVLAPAILLGAKALQTRRTGASAARVAEASVLALAVFAAAYIAFDRAPAGPDTSPALIYLPVPLLIWAVLRFGLGGMSTAMLAIAIMAIWGTMQGRGPFLTQAPAENALALQLFLLMLATPLMLLAVAIGEERRAREALRVSDERMSLAAASAQLAVWDWDIESDQVWVTDEGRKFFGFAPGEYIDHATLGGRVHPDDRAARMAAIEHTLATGLPYDTEYRYVQRDGSTRWLVGRGRRQASVDGARSRVLGVSLDITRQKHDAAQVQAQREELAHLSRIAMVSALSASLAHELSQPLGSILSNAQAGQRFLAKDPPDLAELRDILVDIVADDRRAGGIVARVRTMLRREELVLQPVSVNECLDELLRLTRGELVARGIVVTNLVAADLPLARTDRVQLQQVLLNLIVNAGDAMKSNSPDDRLLTLTASVAEDELCLGVLDCGVGLPEDVESLFQPFKTTKAHGLGMGLSISRSLVTAHNGRLWGERREGRGAAFYVALPLARHARSALG